jgi:membrane-associated phospholipid phosphatase
MWADRGERAFMIGLLAVLAGAWVILATASKLLGVTPLEPWLPGVRLALVALPAGFGLWFVGELLERFVSNPRIAAALAATCGIAVLCMWRVNALTPYIIIALWGLLIARLALATDRLPSRFGWGLLALMCWAALVPHENYIALKLGGGQFHDATFRAMDFRIFHRILGIKDYEGAFPLVKNPIALRILENGYLTMAFQPFVAILCLYRRRLGMAQLFIAGPLCYLIAAIVFAAYPVLGPIFCYADAFDPKMHDSTTWIVSAALRTETQAALRGSAAVSGGAYFIGLPSMHAALAAICQYASRRTAAFWVLLPLNLALLASTVLLGYHYLADALTGLLLGVLASITVEHWLQMINRNHRGGWTLSRSSENTSISIPHA